MIINWIGWSNNIWNERDLYKGMIYTKEKLRELKFKRGREKERERVRQLKYNKNITREGNVYVTKYEK